MLLKFYIIVFMHYFGFRFIKLFVRKLESLRKINDYLYLYYFFYQNIQIQAYIISKIVFTTRIFINSLI